MFDHVRRLVALRRSMLSGIEGSVDPAQVCPPRCAAAIVFLLNHTPHHEVTVHVYGAARTP